MTLTRPLESPQTLPLSLNERICQNDDKIEMILAQLEAQARRIQALEARVRELEEERRGKH